jgi:hypothetical protein
MNEIANKSAYYARIAQYASDEFNTIYLGAKATAPTVDNDGNTLIVGALYFNTVTDIMYSWDGTTWISAIAGANTATTDTNQTITGVKTFTQPIVGSVTGNAATATAIATSRTFNLSGDVVGVAQSFNGTANVSIPSTIANNAVTVSKLGTNEQKQICKAWVSFNGTTSPGTIFSSYNVSSVTKNATGDYTVNFSTPMTNVFYSVATGLSASSAFCMAVTGLSTTSARIYTFQASNLALVDLVGVYVQIFGN